MADPKYANLPGIAHDQPDVFETSELPESDQHIDDVGYMGDNDSVETLHITANEAMGKFKGKYLESGKVDFSDRIQGVGRKGYTVFSYGDYELVGQGETETPVQKYQRLNCEVRELMDEIEKITSAGEKEDKEADNLKGVSIQVDQLQNQLTSLKLDEILGSEKVKNLQDPRGATRDKLINQLSSLSDGKTASGSDKSKDAKSNAANGDVTTYEFYLKPETAKLQQQIELASLEKRLQVIENVIGASPDKMNALSVETNQKSIMNAISVLTARTCLLDPNHLDHVEGRLFALQQKLKELSDKKSIIEDVDKQNKISELYDLVQRNEGIASALPDVVNRLEALENLHHQALDFSKSLSQLDNVQEKLVATMGNNQKLLNETQKKMAENLSTIQSNFNSVESRLEKLGK